jgi:peptide/nickel transport system ATP-binding protein
MLDVSLRAGVLTLLADLRRERGLSLLYITHDLLSARVITDEILVLRHGEVVERGQTKRVLQDPQHEYTRQLLAAVPSPSTVTAASTVPAPNKAAAAASASSEHDVTEGRAT